jgi:hypothetical protein
MWLDATIVANQNRSESECGRNAHSWRWKNSCRFYCWMKWTWLVLMTQYFLHTGWRWDRCGWHPFFGHVFEISGHGYALHCWKVDHFPWVHILVIFASSHTCDACTAEAGQIACSQEKRRYGLNTVEFTVGRRSRVKSRFLENLPFLKIFTCRLFHCPHRAKCSKCSKKNHGNFRVIFAVCFQVLTTALVHVPFRYCYGVVGLWSSKLLVMNTADISIA